MNPIKIGALAKLTGTNAPTIRYYEEIGLLPSADRQAGNQRVYGHTDVRSLTFIRRCRDLGFSIDQVRELNKLMQAPLSPCDQAREVAARHLAAVHTKLAELQELERIIKSLMNSCNVSCAGDVSSECVIFDDLTRPMKETFVKPNTSPPVG